MREALFEFILMLFSLIVAVCGVLLGFFVHEMLFMIILIPLIIGAIYAIWKERW